MEVLKWIGIGFAICCAGSFLFFVLVFLRMIFDSQITELKVLCDRAVVPLVPGVSVTEVPHQRPPLEREYFPGAGSVPAAEEWLLTPEGQLERGERVFDEDPRRPVDVLVGIGGEKSKVLYDGRIFERDGDSPGRELADFSGGPFSGFRHVGGINREWFLVAGDPIEQPYGNTALWQVSHRDYRYTLLNSNVYFTHDRPPKTFSPAGFDGVLVAIYASCASYGFGGYSSAPRYSILRAYTPGNPDGVDLVRLSLKAGTIVDVEWQDGTLLVTADPSRPRSPHRSLPPRLWSIMLPEDMAGSNSAEGSPSQLATAHE
ncbi:hypothetical protein [Microbulbifer aggregans]|uniref:hypothetical protein n=1 Tax=Microbulbifer aggregans TaxID=1769779 RepID=UPI001CFE1991|nr:hypothetical protein [Microbulbifer aggregans]